jgi:Glycosyl transferases group 1
MTNRCDPELRSHGGYAEITYRLPLLISDVARRLARRVGISRHWHTNRVPRLNVALHSAEVSPTAWFICPDFDSPSGGIRKLYRSVDILNDAGLHAAIVHKRPGFSCTWFNHRTKVISSGQVVVSKQDVIVVPEIYGRSICELPAGVRQVIFNQGVYIMLDLLASGKPAAAPYTHNPDLSAVLAVSEDSAAVLEYAFPGLRVKCVRHGIDPAVHYSPPGPKHRRIAYMPRRRGREALQVLELLKLRGVLEGWEVIAIDRRTEADVAQLLRASQIFLSFSQLEGFGLPPFEALACGCLVVGFHGFGGREFFRPPFAIAVEDGDVVAFARAVEHVIRLIDNDPTGMAAASAAGARFVLDRYTRDAERKDLLDVFVPLLVPEPSP